MRPFRDPLTWCAGALAILAATIPSVAAIEDTTYFPLAVGNAWNYRCSVEGQPQAGKVLRIRDTKRLDSVVYYRAELAVGKDPKPLIYYLSVDVDGSVWQSPAASPEGRELLIGKSPAKGQSYGAWVVGGIERTRVPALPNVETVRLENFSLEAPDLPAERRGEWLARYYARNVGPVAEADGLGGSCELTRFKVGNARPN